jgi:hypothetical protein
LENQISCSTPQTLTTIKNKKLNMSGEPATKKTKLELDEEWEKSVLSWREQKEKDMRNPTGWLSVVALEFLNKDVSEFKIGSLKPKDDEKNFILIPNNNSCPSLLGKLHFNGTEEIVHFELLANGIDVIINNEKIEVGKKTLLLDDRGTQKPTEVRII